MKPAGLVCIAAGVLLLDQLSAQSSDSHRIGVRAVKGVGEFYDRKSGATFVPRGNNFIRLAKQTNYAGKTTIYHSTFNVGLYDPKGVELALGRMRSDGYNVVRVFLNSCCREGIGDAKGGLNLAYIANFADFVRRARAHEIFVLPTGDWLPEVGGYNEFLSPYCCSLFGGFNLTHLSPGAVEANRRFWRDFIRELKAQGGPLDAVLAFELRNELFFESDSPPLSWSAGKVTAANSQSYDMADPAAKQKMMDDGLIYFVDEVRAAILEADPTALVTVGFFQPHSPNPTRIGDPRLIRTYPAIASSKADFIDLHAYPGLELTLPQYVANFEMGGLRQKPIIMGEFGGVKGAYSSPESAAQALQAWQVQSCQLGFSGWLLWSWDVEDQPDTNLWSGLSGNGVINEALSPANRPDPCRPGAFTGQNLALNQAAVASRSLPGNPPSQAVDGMAETLWNAGAGPPQWLEINLQKASSIGRIALRISQYPDGQTIHRLFGRGPAQEYRLLTEFRGVTKDRQVLEYTPSAPVTDLQFIRVETVGSPSWVAWREIDIFSPRNGRLPAIGSQDGVVNGASFTPGFTPGSWVTIRGTDLADSVRTWRAEDIVAGVLPTSLDGVRVRVNGKPAALYYISPTQLNVQAPDDDALGPVRVEVIRQGRTSAPVLGELRHFAPGFFGYDAGGSLHVAAVHADGVVVGDPARAPGTRAAKPGERILLFGTGFGWSPAGRVIEAPVGLTTPVTIRVGNQTAALDYAGLVGTGLFQFNIVVPGLPAGDHQVRAEIGGAASPVDVVIRIQP